MDLEQEWRPSQAEISCLEEGQEAVTSLPYLMRALAKNDFSLLKSKGTRAFGKCVKFCFTFGNYEGLELGITAFKKGGNAVARNYFKRLVREVARKVWPQLPKGLRVQVLPLLPLKEISYNEILKDFHDSLCTSIQTKRKPLKP